METDLMEVKLDLKKAKEQVKKLSGNNGAVVVELTTELQAARAEAEKAKKELANAGGTKGSVSPQAWAAHKAQMAELQAELDGYKAKHGDANAKQIETGN